MSGQIYIPTSLLFVLLVVCLTKPGSTKTQSFAEKKLTAIACGPVPVAELNGLRYSTFQIERYAVTTVHSSITDDCTGEAMKTSSKHQGKEGNGCSHQQGGALCRSSRNKYAGGEKPCC